MYVSSCCCCCDFASSLHFMFRIHIKTKKSHTHMYKDVHLRETAHSQIASIRFECNFEDIDISRFQLWLPMLKLDLAFYIHSILFLPLLCIFCSFKIHRDMSRIISRENIEKKMNVTFALLHLHKSTKNKSSFASFFYWKFCKYVRGIDFIYSFSVTPVNIFFAFCYWVHQTMQLPPFSIK